MPKMIPNDIWACCYISERMKSADHLERQAGAFMVRAATYAEAQDKAKRYAIQMCEAKGMPDPLVHVNTGSGEAGLIDLDGGNATMTTEAPIRKELPHPS